MDRYELIPLSALDRVEEELAESLRKSIYSHVLGYEWHEPTWEERLAAAIEARSLRGRVRTARTRFYWWRWERRERLSVAWSALRGRHDCY